jgi:predicted nucleic acid-binding protein
MVRRIVLDTCVIVTAFRSRNGASRVVLDWVADRLLVPLLTPALFLQYEDVLKRPEQLRASRLTPEQVNEILAALASAASQPRFIIRGDHSCRTRATNSCSKPP